ncbi:MAG TPA: rhomboid family intramembrane serine protease [Thermoanaerobaculia bacterium]|nr:rhomboid family intramembrane serine protease [Thermoanaerobaculia bacterium]
MIPIGDDNSDRRSTPGVTWLLIAVNVFVFVALQGFGTNQRFTLAYATVPAEILSGRDIAGDVPVRDEYGREVGEVELQPTPIPVFLTLVTSMFLHGGIAHLLGNMLYLWIFGDNLEDALGHFRYLIFYLLTGVIAGLSHVFVTSVSGANPLIPSLGASGAISGVLGGYIVIFPRRRVRVIFLYSIMEVPAILAIGVWFLFQVLSGAGTLGGQATGVAYGAHVGGFIAGLLLVKPFGGDRRRVIPRYGA